MFVFCCFKYDYDIIKFAQSIFYSKYNFIDNLFKIALSVSNSYYETNFINQSESFKKACEKIYENDYKYGTLLGNHKEKMKELNRAPKLNIQNKIKKINEINGKYIFLEDF